MTSEGFTTCLWLDGQAEEAADHYMSIFKNSKLGRVGRYSEAGPGPAGSVLAVEFEINGQKFVALNGGRSSPSMNQFRSRSAATTRRKWTTTGAGSAKAARKALAGGSRTSTACRGRSCRTCSSTGSATLIP